MKHIILIINYNNYQDTFNCVESISQLHGDKQFVIVDNGSTNNAFDKLTNRYQQQADIHVIQAPSNLGYSKGIDFGYHYIKEHNLDYDFIHVSNSDIVVEDLDFLTKVENRYQQQPFMMLGPEVITHGVNTSPIGYFSCKEDFFKEMKKLNFLAKGLYIFSTVTFNYFENKLEGNRNANISNDVVKRLNNKEHIVPILSGCYIVYSKDHTNLLDYIYRPMTFLYNEEMLITYTLLTHDIDYRQIAYDPNLQVIHKHGGSSKGASKRKAKFIMDNYQLFKKELQEGNEQ